MQKEILDYLANQNLNEIHPGFKQAYDWQKAFDLRDTTQRFTTPVKPENNLIVCTVADKRLWRVADIDLDIQRYEVYPISTQTREKQRFSFGEAFVLNPDDELKNHPGFDETADWQEHWIKRNPKDVFLVHSKLENRFVVFHIPTCRFYRPLHIDINNQRYETFGERKHLWISFGQGFLFDWANVEAFDKLFQLYKNFPTRLRYQSKEKLMTWFKSATRRVGEFIEDLPAELDEGEFSNIYKKQILELKAAHEDISNIYAGTSSRDRYEDFIKRHSERTSGQKNI